MKWNAKLYQKNHNFVSEYGKALLPYVNTSKGMKILDIGCGTGELTYELSKNGADVTGIDSSENMIATAESNYPGIKFFAADALNLPFENYFDTVFSNAVFHWIKNHDLLLENINKVLVKTGALVCEFGAYGNIQLIRSSFEKNLKLSGYEYHNPFFLPSADEYAPLLDKKGFNVEHIEDYDRLTPLKGTKDGMRNFVEQFFASDLEKVKHEDKEKIFTAMETELREKLWNGEIWTADYRRLRLVAKKR